MNAIEKRAALAGAMQKAFGTLLRDGSTGNLDFPAIALSAIHALMGFEEGLGLRAQVGAGRIGTSAGVSRESLNGRSLRPGPETVDEAGFGSGS